MFHLQEWGYSPKGEEFSKLKHDSKRNKYIYIHSYIEKEYKKDIGGAFQQSKKLAGGRLSKGLVSIKFAFEKAAVGARLFGIALVNAIPLIGQIITIGGIALGFLSDFFGRTTAVSEDQKELNTV